MSLFSRPSFYTRQFGLLCASNFLFSASFQMIIPELPPYLIQRGGEQYLGYIIALFTLAAAISRPFSGRLTDTVGRIPVMLFGSLVCFFAGWGYLFTHFVSGFLVLRFLHGMSTGTKPTATAAYVADLTSESQRGQAQSSLSLFTALGMSLGPSLGSWVVLYLSINVMFAVSSALALGSAVILWGMKETLPAERQHRFSWSLLTLKKSEFFEPRAIPPALVTFLSSYSSGVLLTLVPSQCETLGIANKGLFFSIYTLSSLFVRILFGKFSDKYGRIVVLLVSMILLSISMITIALASDVHTFYLGAILFGFSWGFNTPTLTAWTIDVSVDNARGKALSTMFIALELGIGLGAWFSGELYGRMSEGIFYAYTLAAVFSIGAFLYLWQKSKRKMYL